MYSRFLKEAGAICKNKDLLLPAGKIQQAGEIYSEIGNLFKEAEVQKDLPGRIKTASECFNNIADLEEAAFIELTEIVSKY